METSLNTTTTIHDKNWSMCWCLPSFSFLFFFENSTSESMVNTKNIQTLEMEHTKISKLTINPPQATMGGCSRTGTEVEVFNKPHILFLLFFTITQKHLHTNSLLSPDNPQNLFNNNSPSPTSQLYPTCCH